MSFTSTYSSLSSRGWQSSGTGQQLYSQINAINGPVFPSGDFGLEVAISEVDTGSIGDNIIAAGMPAYQPSFYTNQGAVYISDFAFTTQFLSGNTSNTGLGYKVAISDDAKYAIGTTFPYSGANAGFANVYSSDAFYNYSFQQKLTSNYTGRFTSFVETNNTGNVIALTCAGDNPANVTNAGSVVVFNRSGNSWSETTRLYANDVSSTNGKSFGSSLSYSYTGNCLAVGATGDANSGAVYIFNNNIQTAKIVASNRVNAAAFGASCALSKDADYLVVGATGESKAYVFANTSNVWTEIATLTGTSSNLTVSGYARDVAVSSQANTIVVTAPFSTSGANQRGSLYIYTKDGNTFNQSQEIINPGSYTGTGSFGDSISMTPDGKRLAVGDAGFKSGSNVVGRIYLYQSFF